MTQLECESDIDREKKKWRYIRWFGLTWIILLVALCYISFVRLMNDFVGSFYAQLNPCWWCKTFLNELTMFDIVLGKDNGTSISTEKINTQHLFGEMQTVFWRQNIRHNQQKRWKKYIFLKEFDFEMGIRHT